MTNSTARVAQINPAFNLNRRHFLALAGAGAAALTLPRIGRAQDAKPETIKLDFAYYNPTSLVLRRNGWLEADLEADGIGVEWTQSAGSNKANEFLKADAIDFGSTAGSAALLAKSNGSNIQNVYIYSQPEWAALVAPSGSDITTIEQLKGKKVAATKGTDPYIFLLRSLESVGLSETDIEVVNIQHADGKTALLNGDVDAWSGLDPHMAQAEIDNGATLFYRNINFNTYGFLNARQAFIDEYPAYVGRVLAQYEVARAWALANLDATAQILSEESGVSIEVATKVITERTVLDLDVVPGDAQRAALEPVIPILENEDQLQPGADPQAALDGLLNPSFASTVAVPAGTPVATPEG